MIYCTFATILIVETVHSGRQALYDDESLISQDTVGILSYPLLFPPS